MFKNWLMVLVVVLAALSLGLVSVPCSYGKDYPTKPIEIMVTYGPGTINDTVSRLCAEIGRKYLSQPLVVVNKPGAAATTGVAEVINSRPDGYKLIYLPHNYFATTVRTQKIPFDPTHLTPLIGLAELRQTLGVRGDSPWKTIHQLLDYGKQNRGTLRVANPGVGAGGHICNLIVFRKAGVEIIDLPYVRGATDILPALLGGHVDAALVEYSAGKSHIDTGRIRLLVTYSEQRHTVTPDVPCTAELGFETIVTYHALYVHKNVPENIKKTLLEAFQKIRQDPEFMKGLDRIGVAPKFEGPEFIKQAIKKTEGIGVPIIKELGLYVGEPPKAP